MPVTADPGRKPVDPREIPLNTDFIKTKWLNVPYVEHPHERQVLDVYHPNGKTGPFPFIVCIYGGGFRSGDKTYGEFKAVVKALEYGYAVVSINYRYSQQAPHPAQMHDAKAAIRFIRAHAADYDLIPDKMALWGGSAGAMLSSLIGVTADTDVMTDRGMGNPGVSEAAQAVVDWYGPVDFNLRNQHFAEPGAFPPRAGFDSEAHNCQLFGCTREELPEKSRPFNPMLYITEQCPPFLIQHGTNDDLVPLKQAVIFHEALKKVIGDRAEFDILDGVGHGGDEFGAEQNIQRVMRFLDKYLKP